MASNANVISSHRFFTSPMSHDSGDVGNREEEEETLFNHNYILQFFLEFTIKIG